MTAKTAPLRSRLGDTESGPAAIVLTRDRKLAKSSGHRARIEVV